jgi:hypothetical protein
MRRRDKQEPKAFETWVIRNRVTGEFFVAPSGKNAWKAVNHAKNAWASVGSGYWYGDEDSLSDLLSKYNLKPSEYRGKRSFPYFDEQQDWECVNLNQSIEQLGIRLKAAEDLLKSVRGTALFFHKEAIDLHFNKYLQENNIE